MLCRRSRPVRPARIGFLLLGLASLLLGPGLLAEKSQAPPAGSGSVPAYRQADTVAVLSVRGNIDRVTLASLERRVERAVEDGATAIVLDIDTPGGDLNATLDICDLIKTDAPANTVAWINPQAYSAGTIIALAAREIVVAPNARFGDAAPIAGGIFGLVPLPDAERAKFEAPVLEEVIDSARLNHYDEKLVQAFVSVGVELWLIEHVETGDRIFVDRNEYRTVFGAEPPTELTRVAPPATEADDRVRPWIDQVVPSLPRRSGEAEEEAGAEYEFLHQLPSPRPTLTADDRQKYQPIKQVISSDRLLVLRPADAVYYGLAQTVISNDEELKAYFGARDLVRYDEVWSEGLARFLMSGLVRIVLGIVFLVALVLELTAPGTGLFGITAGVALLLIVGAPMLIGMAQWVGLALIVLGLILIAVELLVIPGVGVAGVAGLLSLLIGLIATFVTGDVTGPYGQMELWRGVAMTLTVFFGAAIVVWLVSRNLRSLAFLDWIILKTELGSPDRLRPAEPAAQPGGPQQGTDGAEAATAGAGGPATAAHSAPVDVGDIGIAYTDLRPAGRGEFGGRIIDVQSPGGFIEKGTPIRVFNIGKYVIEVEEAEE